MSLSKFFPISALLVLEDGGGSGGSGALFDNKFLGKGGNTCNNRIYSKYYPNEELFSEENSKLDFEKSIMKRISTSDSDFIIHQDRMVLFRRSFDVVIMIVAKMDENEMFLYEVIECLLLVLREVIKPQLDSIALLDNYDLLVVALDQIIMEGIPLDLDSLDIISRLEEKKTLSFRSSSVNSILNSVGGSSSSHQHTSPIADAATQGLSSAFSFAKNTMKSFLSK